jgi:hypothetical protein
VIPLANYSTADGLRDQFLKSRGPRLGERFLHEPIPAEIISHCVWLYFRFCLSYRDVEELMAELGVLTHL